MRKTDHPEVLIGCEIIRGIYHRCKATVNRNRYLHRGDWGPEKQKKLLSIVLKIFTS